MTLPPTQWIIFDGDNTLWNVEILYDEARAALCRLLTRGAATAGNVERFQRETDAELYRLMGYSRHRFPRSFTETARHYLVAGDDRIEAARRLAEQVFERAAVPADDVDEVLAELARSYRLALLTAGEPEVQRARLAHFGREHYFAEVRIVERKDVATIARLLLDVGADPARSWMVGDSLKSDIVPAVGAGLNAVHLDVANWREVEAAGSSLPGRAHVARTLREAADLILQSSRR